LNGPVPTGLRAKPLLPSSATAVGLTIESSVSLKALSAAEDVDGALRAELGILDRIEGELHRFGVEGGAVVEDDVFAQGEGPRQKVVGDLPRGGQTGHEVSGAVVVDQRIEDLKDHLLLGSSAPRAATG
jgi:hypothetical protein